MELQLLSPRGALRSAGGLDHCDESHVPHRPARGGALAGGALCGLLAGGCAEDTDVAMLERRF